MIHIETRLSQMRPSIIHSKTMKHNLIVAILMAIASASYSQVSDFRYLKDSLPESWQYEPALAQVTPSEDKWWDEFGDPTLKKLINLAVQNNYNVVAAMKRIESARLAQRNVSSGYYPIVNGDFGWQRDQTAGTVHGEHSHPSVMNYFTLGLSMQWEMDVFGRIAEQQKVSKATYDVSVADYDATLVSLVSNLAKAYFQLRMYQAQYKVLSDNVAVDQDLLNLAQARYDAGLRPMLDLVQARMVVTQTKASLPPLEANISNSLYQIALLCGEYPEKLDYLLTPAPLPDVPQLDGIANPAYLLRRRPDIIAAERNVAAMAARVGVAKKDFLPSLSLSASVATEALSFNHLFGKNSLSYNIAPQLTWTLFDGFSRKYKLAEARINMEAEIDSYNFTVMSAVQEMNSALASWKSLAQQEIYQTILVKESKRQLELQIDRYKQGLNSWSDIGGAQTTLLANIDTQIELQASRLSALISIYTALGGGF